MHLNCIQVSVSFLTDHLADPPGSRLAVNLHSVTRAPTIQHIADRINLICAQNNLSVPSRNSARAYEFGMRGMFEFIAPIPTDHAKPLQAKLKQLITRALTLTSTSQTITSITPSSTSVSQNSHLHHHHPQRAPILTPTSFQTLFTISPSDLPNRSAAAMRLMTATTPSEASI